MAKYKVGQLLRDKEEEVIYTIIGISPKLDYENQQTYWVECLETVEGEKQLFYYVYDENFLDHWTEMVTEN